MQQNRSNNGLQLTVQTSSTRTHWPPNSPDLNPLDYHVWGWMLHKSPFGPTTAEYPGAEDSASDDMG